MRIISGRFKGRRLVEFKAPHIRPTSDRVKESLFNILQAEFAHAQVLDLFCGTGNLGLEALSRGAAQVTFVDDSGLSLQILKKNIQLLDVANEVEVVRSDAFSFLKKEGAAFDVMLIDPPFTEQLAHSILECSGLSPRFKAGGVLAIESAKKERVEDAYPGLDLLDRRSFGDKNLSIFRKKV